MDRLFEGLQPIPPGPDDPEPEPSEKSDDKAVKYHAPPNDKPAGR
jgi:hypothetical protein